MAGICGGFPRARLRGARVGWRGGSGERLAFGAVFFIADRIREPGSEEMHAMLEDTERERMGLEMVLAGLEQGLAFMPEGSVSSRALLPLAADLRHRIEVLAPPEPRRRRDRVGRRWHAW